MADTITLSLAPEVMERLQRLAEASGESVEALARGVLEETAAEFGDLVGDDVDVSHRLAAWREHRTGIEADELYGWLERRLRDPNAARPPSKRFP